MSTINDILDKVDGDLMKLIDANENFGEYRKITTKPLTSSAVNLHGSIGFEIDAKKVLGLSINNRG